MLRIEPQAFFSINSINNGNINNNRRDAQAPSRREPLDVFVRPNPPDLFSIFKANDIENINLPKIVNYIVKPMLDRFQISDHIRCIKSLTKDQVKKYQLISKNNNLYFKHNSFRADGEKSLNYVLSGQGEIFAHRAIKNVFHHSSFLAGEPVACAGEITIRDGKVVDINNRSGHYRPTAIHLLQTIITLHHMGVISPSCRVDLHRKKTVMAKDLLQFLSKISPNLPRSEEEALEVIEAVRPILD